MGLWAHGRLSGDGMVSTAQVGPELIGTPLEVEIWFSDYLDGSGCLVMGLR